MMYLKSIRSVLPVIVALAFISVRSCSGDSTWAVRDTSSFNSEWKFILSDEDYSAVAADDSDWRVLNVPHDWSIEGEFSPEHPATTGGGALPGGVGWYRKEFTLSPSDSEKNIFIHFGGIYWNSEVYLNGALLGKRPNGYVSFMYDMTPHLRFDGEKNVIAVKVDNSNQPNSRWYSGSGIYRNVNLIKTTKEYIDFNNTFVTTPEVNSGYARVDVRSEVRNSSTSGAKLKIGVKINSTENKTIDEKVLELEVPAGGSVNFNAQFDLSNPALWSIENPNLYTLNITVLKNGKAVDDESTRFGIRKLHFDSAKGFFLNDKSVKILGVCNHHDLGSLGSAVNRRAIERQLEILKGMGCNAIRTAHNPPAPELLELCDEMGFLVMNETFDMWKKRKSPHDYSQYYDEWHVRDLTDHILRDRNHPSVFMWSIGNEILEQWDSTGIEMTKELYNIVRNLDTTRQIVTGNNYPYPGNMLLVPDVMDVIGYNYKHEEYERFPEVFPGKFFIATETTSGLMTRGHYDMPSDSIRRWPYRWDRPFYDGNPDHTVSSYDNVSAPWGSTHEETWSVVKKHDYLSGMFIWTGFDYLGEPTPYGWPSRSSYFGVVDLAGFPKDVYYMYKSEWTSEPVLHIFPHWNWTPGEEVDVLAYTNCSSVELFLNGESVGKRANSDTAFHLMWRLEFEPGELKAVGTLPSGEKLETIVQTSGEPKRLEILADRDTINADGEDLSFITVNVLDENGVVVPYADNMITCDIEGDAVIAGVDNGNQVSHEPFRANYRKAFNGKSLFIVRSGSEKGTATIRFSADGLESSEIKLKLQ